MILEKENIRIELRDHLFWDVPENKLDLERNKKLIIERVSGRGNKREFASICSYYGINAIKQSIMRSKDTDLRTRNFIMKLPG